MIPPAGGGTGKAQAHLCSCLQGAMWACWPLGPHFHITQYDLYCLGGLLGDSKGICFAYVVLIIDPEYEFISAHFLNASFLPEWTIPEGQGTS